MRFAIARVEIEAITGYTNREEFPKVSEHELETPRDRYADPAGVVSPIGAALTGAAAAGREFLVSEYGSIEAVEAEIRPRATKVGHARNTRSRTEE
jgi:hypothetical protein